MYALILLTYWLIFFQRFLRNPWLLCTSELASTFFPHWMWMGRKWRASDSVFYKHTACIPFLSMWYPPSILVSKASKFLSMNGAFRLYSLFILSHYYLGSILAFMMFSQWVSPIQALFGALTLTYSAYNIKPQTPCSAFTVAWMSGMLIQGPIGILSCAMAILGGYFPVLVYFMPIAIGMNAPCLLGVLLALPQIIPFLWYWPKSIRHGNVLDEGMGVIRPHNLLDLVKSSKSVTPVGGAHYPETELYMGIACFLIFHPDPWWMVLVTAIGIALGFLPSIQHIPARVFYVLTFSITMLATQSPIALWIIILQAYLLLRNAHIYPSFPFSQWWNSPERLYHSKPYDGSWPNCTGYLRNEKISTYKGQFRMRDSS